jgi:hypothetical protein
MLKAEETSELPAAQDKRQTPRHSRMVVLRNVAERVKRHEEL